MVLLAVFAVAPLFATDDVNHGATLVACLMAALSGFFSWLSGRENRLANRDKMEYEAERVQLHADVNRLKEEHADCEERHNELAHTVDAQREQMAAEIAELRRRLDDRSSSHDRVMPPGLDDL